MGLEVTGHDFVVERMEWGCTGGLLPIAEIKKSNQVYYNFKHLNFKMLLKDFHCTGTFLWILGTFYSMGASI